MGTVPAIPSAVEHGRSNERAGSARRIGVAMNRALLALAGLASIAAFASPAQAHVVPHEPAFAPSTDVVQIPFGRILRDGAQARFEVDPSRVLMQAEILWQDRRDDSRAAILADGAVIARRYVGDVEREVVRVMRPVGDLRVLVERGRLLLDAVVLRYAGPPTIEPSFVSATSAFARTAHFHRAVESGARLRLPAGFTGMRVTEVRVQASSLDFRSSLRLEGPDVRTRVRTIGGLATYVFAIAEGHDDASDLTLVADLRRLRIEDVTLVLRPAISIR
jgi:hypothetical protein